MVTKWKSRFLLVVWSLLLTIGLAGICVLIIYGPKYVYQDYFQTPQFQKEIDTFASLLYLFDMNNSSTWDILEEKAVTNEEVERYRYLHGELEEQIAHIHKQYDQRISSVQKHDKNKENVDRLIAEREEKIKDVTNNFISDEHVREKIITEREKKIEELNRILQTYLHEFRYYFTHSPTNQVYTNLSHATSESVGNDTDLEDMLYITEYSLYSDEQNSDINDYKGSTSKNSQNGWYEGKIAVPKSLSSASPIIKAFQQYKQEQLVVWLFILLSATVLISCFIISKEIHTTLFSRYDSFYNTLPLDVRVILFILTGICGGWLLIIAAKQVPFMIQDSLFYGVDTMAIIGISSIPVRLTVTQGKYLSKTILEKGNLKPLISRSLLNWLYQILKKFYIETKHHLQLAFLKRKTGTQVFLVLGLIFALGFGAVLLVMNPLTILIYLFTLVMIGTPIVLILIKKIGFFNQIYKKTNEIAAGELGNDLTVKGNSVLATFSHNINLLKKEIEKSQSEQVKSERLKTELLTNVSHDLRTPLTSIITYTELLKQEKLSVEQERSYLEIIDRKSKLLKVLIDDLFEISKMTSGNVELTLAKVDLVQLLQQALGEYDDLIQNANLQFLLSKPETPVYVNVDGQKLWRVFDNLIGNILKYSLDHSRVYISISKSITDGEGTIIFKNVSKYELNDNDKELVERFKRGDTSRHTEGAGLGLAIAESIMRLHHGTLEIETDGDLFKAIVKINLDEG